MAKRKKLTEDQKREIEILKSNNQMYERTLNEVRGRGGSETVIQQIKEAKSDIEHKLREFGVDDVYIEESDNPLNNILPEVNDVNIYRPEAVDNVIEETEESVANASVKISENEDTVNPVINGNPIVNDDGIQYDVIPLPSNGECYPSKTSRLSVAYLTAYDENMIMSPNLYRDGLIIDYLLKNKVLNPDFNSDDLVSGDADAITLFLRATSYGTDYPISVLDNVTGERIETTLDLSTLKLKEMKIKGDENGYFDFTLPMSKKAIKFKYLTRREEKMLDKLSSLESEEIRAEELRGVVSTINSALKLDKTLNTESKEGIVKSVDKINDWIVALEKNTKTIRYSLMVTNRMEMQIMSVDGNTDRKFIHDVVMKMPAKDSLALRKYISDNEPGVDFNITVDRPASLGGGSINTFLNWEDTVFLNVA